MAGKTVIVHSKNAPSYVRCTSTRAFVNPAAPPGITAAQVNQKLNLNLGQKLLNPENKTLLWILRFVNNLLLGWWEHHAFAIWKKIPLQWRRKLTFWAWELYLPLHKALLGRRTGIHPDASLEYHALTTVLWAGRLFPVSIERMRFSLSQLNVVVPTKDLVPSSRVEEIVNEPYAVSDASGVTINSKGDTWRQANHCHVNGLYVHLHPDPTEYALFWVYGGAFLSGDAPGNLAHAQQFAQRAGTDVFIASHRLVPEAKLSDLIWDVCLAYRWFCQKREREGKDPGKILMLGISSGGALVMRILQSIADVRRGEATLPDYLPLAVKDVPMPSAAALLGPFCDFTAPAKGSLAHYPQHDLIVNQRVAEHLSYLDTHCDGGRRENSPVHRSFAGGLPPLCVVCSQHEAVYDHAIDLVNAARAAGVPVTVGVWQYMCHVFPFFSGFIPEGQQSTEFVCDWLREQQQQRVDDE